MRYLSEEAKQEIVKKVLSNNGQTLREIALANNIGTSTLSEWLKKYRIANKIGIDLGIVGDSSITLADRFKHLQSTMGQDDATVGAYCRTHGLYSHQLTQWENDFMTQKTYTQNQKETSELRSLRTENKALKQTLLRKDKVLAETVALLVLKKKAAHIWGESEDD
jgi:transposase